MPTVTIPTGAFSFTYHPDTGPCAGCTGPVPPAHIEVEDQAYCDTCLGTSGEYSEFTDLITPANTWHQFLTNTREGQRPDWLADMHRLLRHLGDHLVPEGTGEDMDNTLFAAELITRAGRGGVDQREMLALLGRLCPDLTAGQLRDIYEKGKRAATAHLARIEADQALADCAMIVLTRAEGPTIGEACDQLSIDLDTFVGVATTKAAEHGVQVRDLPLDVVDECLTAAHDDRPASLRKAMRDHDRHCRANGLNPTDPEVFRRYVDNLPQDAKDYVLRKVIEDRIEAAFTRAVEQGHAVRVSDGEWETVPGHDDAVKDLLGAALAGDLDDEPDDPQST